MAMRTIRILNTLPQPYAAQKSYSELYFKTSSTFSDSRLFCTKVCSNQTFSEDPYSTFLYLFSLDRPAPAGIYHHIFKLFQKNQNIVSCHVRLVMTHITMHQHPFDCSLGKALVLALCRCGCIEDALYVFDALSSQTSFSWTSIITCYVDNGWNREALRMYTQMIEYGAEPNKYTFVSLFKACGNLKNVELGKKIHAHSRAKGLVCDVYVGSTLVSMYGKCSELIKAENAFCEISQRTFVSWNAMLSAYVEGGQGKKALLLYRQMQEEGMCPSELTYIIALQACSILAEVEEIEESGILSCTTGRLMSFEIGKALHADSRKKGFDSNTSLCNTIISMYGKCGGLSAAENLFNDLSNHTIVSWNAMIIAYVEHGEGEKALQLYREMQMENITPDRHTYACVIRACTILAEEEETVIVEGKTTKVVSLGIGQALHADANQDGFDADSFVGTALVNFYGKCGLIEEAEAAFLALHLQDIVSWTAMISAYVEQGQGIHALQAYRQMQGEGLSIDKHVILVALQACGIIVESEEIIEIMGCSVSSAVIDIGHALHADARKKGFFSYQPIINTLISMYGKCGSILESEHVFSGSSTVNTVTCNALLSAYVDESEIQKPLQFYCKMLKDNITPDDLTFLTMFQVCGYFAEKEVTHPLQGEIKEPVSIIVLNALHDDALKKDVCSHPFVHSTLVSAYAKNGNITKAIEILSYLSTKAHMTWDAVLSAYAEKGQHDEVLRLYKDMQNNGTYVTKATIIPVLRSCSETGCVEICKQIHFCMVSAGYESNPILMNCIIHAYGSCAEMNDALAVFEALLEPSIISWNALLAANAPLGNCFQFLEKMQLSGIDPNEVTFLSLLSICSHTGDVAAGVKFYEVMCQHSELTPGENHNAVMVDLLGRAGDFKHVENLLMRFPTPTDLSIWLRLLGVCRTHGNVELGKWAFDHAVSLNPENAALYIWMFNIYAAASLQREERVMHIMEDNNRMFISNLNEEMQGLDTRCIKDPMHVQEKYFCGYSSFIYSKDINANRDSVI